MGSSLILIVIAAVAGFFLVRKFGLPGLVLSLGNSSQSRFSRSEANGQILFNVTPARPSRAALTAIALGVLLLMNVNTLEIIAIFGLIPLVMGLMAFPIGARHRRPATIAITQQQLQSGGKSWPLEQITAINVRRGSRINTDEPAPVMHRTAAGGLVYGSKSTSAMFSRALNRRVIERSYLVTLRTRAGSDETVLSGGLTLECADALRRDLCDVVSTGATPASDAVA